MNGRNASAAFGEPKRQLSYDVRIWKTRLVNGAKGRRYQVRWTVSGEIHYSTFATKALADSHQAKLKTAAREGEAFDLATGLPLSVVGQGHEDEDHDVSWFEFACAYVDMKWPEVSPNSRRSIADSLATATSALLSSQRGAPKPDQLRKALYGWAFNVKQRESPRPQLSLKRSHGSSATRSRWLTSPSPTPCAVPSTNSPASKTARPPPRPS